MIAVGTNAPVPTIDDIMTTAVSGLDERDPVAIAPFWRASVTAVYTLALVLGTHLPDDHNTVTTAIRLSDNDRAAHFLAYFGLAVLAFGLCRVAAKPHRVAPWLIGLAAFGAVDELTQPWFGRTAEWLDWTADLGGLTTGLLAVGCWDRFVRSRSSKGASARLPVDGDAAEDRVPVRRGRARVIPYALALGFAVWSLWGVDSGNPLHSDASRHAMNGALIHDYIAAGKLQSPIRFAEQYYDRLPALSMPFHPPLFPAYEAAWFAVLGVNLFAARLAVAIAVGACVVLLFRLVESTHGSVALATAVPVAFLALPMSSEVGHDVMLEFPALLLLLGAVYCVRDLPRRMTLGSAIGFGLLGGAAVWTKQHTVFLGLIPFVAIGLARSGWLLVRPPVWVAAFLVGGLVLLLLAVPQPPSYKGFVHEMPLHGMFDIVPHNAAFYFRSVHQEFGTAAGAVILAATAVYLARQLSRGGGSPELLYLAWSFAAIGFLLLIGRFDTRYALFAFPAFVVLGMAGLAAVGRRIAGLRGAAVAPIVAATLALAPSLAGQPYTMSGPDRAAEYVVADSARRILYCGLADGAFIFSVRTLDPTGQVTVIRGDKLPAAALTPAGMAEFTRRHGIDRVVLHRTVKVERWAAVWETPPASWEFETEFPVAARPNRLYDGLLRIYRVTDPSPYPEPYRQRR